MARSDTFYSSLTAAEKVIQKRKLKFDYNGHYNFEEEYIKSDFRMALYSFSEEQLNAVVAKKKLSKPVTVALGLNQCPHCGVRVKFLFDGETLKSDSVCKYPGGLKEVVIELNVPSGKMVFANDLRHWFRTQGDFNVNNDVGIMLTTQAYEKVGMAHGFVSNTCPSVYKVNKQTLSISGAPSEEYWDEKKKDYLSRSKADIKKDKPKGKRVGGICTDLWWYCIVDYEDFKTRFLDSGTEKEFDAYVKDRCDVVDVKPGVFTVQHLFSGARDYDAKGQHHYAHITWAREPEQRNLYQQYKKLNRTISQCWMISLAQYPTLYCFQEEDLPKELTMAERVEKLKTFSAERLEHSYQRFLDHIFCTIGNGVDWHENGWGTSGEVPEGTPEFPTPVLTQKYHWYPMSRNYSSLYLAAHQNKNIFKDEVHLNESFLAGAYEIVHCMLTYKVERRNSITHESIDKEKHDKELENVIKEAEEQVVIAQECLEGLAKRYPGTVPDKLKRYLT
ncbi:MAG TPA: hypothetical protein VM577_14390 [Anaerovoracaceae bacterium]|nr:hypothetical protein [Anaerovoracaceae bacterium]